MMNGFGSWKLFLVGGDVNCRHLVYRVGRLGVIDG